MPTAALSKSKFEHEVEHLVGLKAQVAKVLRPAVDAILAFAVEYWNVYQVVELDPSRVTILRERLGITEDYQHQRFRRIAEQSAKLRPLSHALPAGVEPLYEAALVAAKNPKRLKSVTPDFGIRDIRELKKPQKAKRHDGQDAEPSSNVDVAVTLTVTAYTEKYLAKALAILLEEDAQARVRCDSNSVIALTKEALAVRYETRAKAQGETVPSTPLLQWDPLLAHAQLKRGTTPNGTKADDVTKNEKHPYHSEKVPNPAVAERLFQDAEKSRWLLPEIGLTYEHYVPELASRQARITKR